MGNGILEQIVYILGSGSWIGNEVYKLQSDRRRRNGHKLGSMLGEIINRHSCAPS